MASKAYECLKMISDDIIANKEYLTELDAAIGDADHGINMARGFTEVTGKVPQDLDDIGAMCKKTGMVLISKVGGSSGPLYGTAFMKAGAAADGKRSLTPKDMEVMLEAAVEGIKYRGKAVRGEKTMLDSLEPALDALKADVTDSKSIRECLDDMCTAAEKGAELTKTYAATKGRASYLGERSIGHEDPGAVSSLIMLKAIDRFISNEIK